MTLIPHYNITHIYLQGTKELKSNKRDQKIKEVARVDFSCTYALHSWKKNIKFWTSPVDIPLLWKLFAQPVCLFCDCSVTNEGAPDSFDPHHISEQIISIRLCNPSENVVLFFV